MIPVLFSANATSWGTFGIGALTETVSCEVTEERNGSYELEMTYPVTGVRFGDLELRKIVLAKPNFMDNPQPFRIYQISKPMNGVVTINAQHISYDLSGYVDAPLTATGSQDIMTKIVSNTYVTPTGCPFTFSTDITESKPVYIRHPMSIRSFMGGSYGSLLTYWRGEWSYDGYSCVFSANRGLDRGVTIRYGKNLTNLRQEENNASVYTGIYPYYYNSDTKELVTLTEKTISAAGTFSYTKILPLDLTDQFEDVPTETALRSKANAYLTNNDIGVPKVSLELSFVQLDQLQERVDLCDTVHVYFDALGVSASAKCVRTVWNVLKGRYEKIELGSVRSSIADTIAEIKETAEQASVATSQYSETAQRIADRVTGNLGGYIVLNDTDADGNPDELLVLDTPDIATAVKIIRINNGGIAFSQDGYYGTYNTAWNIDSEFSADFISTGTLDAARIDVDGLFALQATIDALNAYDIRGNSYLSLVVSGLAVTYTQWTDPASESGNTVKNGDIWIKEGPGRTHEQLEAYKHSQLASYPYWALESNKQYLRKNGAWELIADPAGYENSIAEIQMQNNEILIRVQQLDDGKYSIQSGIDILTAGIEISGSKYIKIKSGGSFLVDSGNFSIDSSGNVTLTGAVTATSGSFTGTLTSTNGTIGGWTLDTKKLYSGSGSGYVCLDSNTSDTYAIWAGHGTASSAPFRVKRDGSVYLTKLIALAEDNTETTVNLRSYPLWKLNYKTIKSVVNGVVTLSDNSTFNTAASVVLSGSWSGETFTVTGSNGQSVSTTVTAVAGSWNSSGKFTFYAHADNNNRATGSTTLGTPTATGVEVSAGVFSITFDFGPFTKTASANINASYSYTSGRNSVTLSGAWNGGTYTVTASNGATNSITVSAVAGTWDSTGTFTFYAHAGNSNRATGSTTLEEPTATGVEVSEGVFSVSFDFGQFVKTESVNINASYSYAAGQNNKYATSAQRVGTDLVRIVYNTGASTTLPLS